MSVSIDVAQAAAAWTVTVAGEVDVSNAAELRAALDGCLAQPAPVVEVDMERVSYIDSTGIGVLVGGAHRAEEAGGSLKILNPQRNVARVLALLGVDERLGAR